MWTFCTALQFAGTPSSMFLATPNSLVRKCNFLSIQHTDMCLQMPMEAHIGFTDKHLYNQCEVLCAFSKWTSICWMCNTNEWFILWMFIHKLHINIMELKKLCLIDAWAGGHILHCKIGLQGCWCPWVEGVKNECCKHPSHSRCVECYPFGFTQWSHGYGHRFWHQN